ncbi:MAG: nitric oxide reductase transcriptional regulator NorR [Kofleriaceae bacterium]|nr:nitric oxide reductase transcriptional regulator NorR [Myxococcales bacterium]MCB9562973.1 nitric oxide reductase transcriptional regulator NorR [Kofleriaceae bacterium]MCB9572365.1 nitric oxide reductase transcriptional regulator NorR [Kofleriaceae bacterium]
MLDTLIGLCAGLGHEDRYERLTSAVRALIPCDSTALLRLEGDTLIPVASEGLVPEATSRRFVTDDHPRLAQILRARRPVRFRDARLPDPFDGLVVGWDPRDRVHACMGCPLIVDGEVLGVLTVDAIEPGAFDDVDDDLVAAVASLCGAALRTSRLIGALEDAAARANLVARELLREHSRPAQGLLGRSAATDALRHEVELAAQSDLAVLITGETGTGKEVVARAIHAASGRRERPLVHVNCAALPESLAESELFGHVRGSFTGAVDQRAGKFEVADGGTLFLDEVGELPLTIQPKLLRALQFGEIQRVGADRARRVDVRIIAATNRDLEADVAAGRFRADLFHRLSVYPVTVAPLRERREDIAVLAGHFLDEARQRLGLTAVRLTAAARESLEQRPWPGNARELDHVILRAAVRAAAGLHVGTVVIDEAHLGPVIVGKAVRTVTSRDVALSEVPLRIAVDDFQRERIREALAAADGNWAEAARRLGLDRGNLHRLARRLGMVGRPRLQVIAAS